jgi:hypothetical protein
MAARPNPLSDFDCRIAGTTAEVGNDVPSANVRRFIESRSRWIPLEHVLISTQSVLVDVDPMILVERVASHGRTFLMS